MVWTGTPGSGDLTMPGDFTVASTHNIHLGSDANAASGQNVLAMANAPTNPVSLAGLAGGVCYVQSGQLNFMDVDGITTLLSSPSQKTATRLALFNHGGG